MSSLISLKNVTKNYYIDADSVITPISDVNMEIEKGEFVMIIGRSGSGKTTLLNVAAGLIKPTSGQACIDDKNLQSMSDRQLCLLRNKRIGFIFQFPSLLPSLTALENVVMPVYLAPRNGRDDPYIDGHRLIKMVGLSQRERSYPKHLSSGEQRRVVIARALINNPDILLADEPTSDLDLQTEKEVMAFLKEIHDSGVTIIMVTHGMDLIPHADRVFKMEAGVLSSLDVQPGMNPFAAKEEVY
jgi:putative ABC transport system ATP-binding protein